MNDEPSRRLPQSVSRRSLLKTAGAISGAFTLGLTGCAGDTESPTASGAFDIPDAVQKLPTTDVTVRVMATPDAYPAFWDKFGAAYKKKHPNISINYDGFPIPRIQEVLPLAIKNGDAHDIFILTPTLNPRKVVSEGWVAPLDDVIPDFAKWKAAFPSGSFIPGINVFDGKTYSFPIRSAKTYVTLVLSNSSLLQRADVDFSSGMPTWSEFREAMKKITKQGNGRYYGLAMPGVRLANTIGWLARAADGAAVRDISPRTGEYIYGADGYRAAVELLRAMQSDGSLLPGSVSMTAQEAPPRVLAGNAAVIIDGPWTPAQWEDQNPDFEFGLHGLPVPDSGKAFPQPAATPTADYWLYGKSKLKDVVGDIFSYVGSVQGAVAAAPIFDIAITPVYPEAFSALRKSATKNGQSFLDLDEGMIVPPYPEIRNPDAARVLEELRLPQPGPAQVLEGIMVGDIKDSGKALKDLSDRSNRALDSAIAAARAKGVWAA
jgi:multiple sugar transport system substrate-binding protein